MSAHEGFKGEETGLNAKELRQAKKGLRYKLENGRSDKKDEHMEKTQRKEKEGTSNMV